MKTFMNKKYVLAIFLVVLSILYYCLVIMGQEIYWQFMRRALELRGEQIMVSGLAMQRFANFWWFVLTFFSLFSAIKFYRGLSIKALMKMLPFSILPFVLFPFIWRTGGGFLDFGPIFDALGLGILYWVHGGLFFITLFVFKFVDSRKRENSEHKLSK